MDSDNTRPHIGVDGYNLAMPHGTGVATYARTLCNAIKRAGYGLDLVYGLPIAPDSRPEQRESLFFSRLGEETGEPYRPKGLRATMNRALTTPMPRNLVEIPIGGRVLAPELSHRAPAADRLFSRSGIFTISARHFRRYRRFMILRMPNPPAVMHWTYPLPLRIAGTRNVYTVHDLVPLRLPQTSLEDKRYYENLITACLAGADRIATVSEASRDDILRLFEIDPDKVVNTGQAVDVARPQDDRDALARRLRRLFDLEIEGYFLFFGAIEPKKNVGRLIEAYMSAELDTPFVIVGGRGWRSDQELRLLGKQGDARLAAAANIRQIEYLPRHLLLELVQGARGVLFPSLYEGFGLPAAEAMALGVPVLASNTGSLPEVVGDAALLVDPYDVGAMAAALRQLDTDVALRARLAGNGRARAERFSMEAYTRTMKSFYTGVLGGEPGAVR